VAPSPQGKHHCARTPNNVLCWGLNNGGQAGDVSDAGTVPGAVGFGITAALAVAAGSGNSCAIRPDRTLTCWGFNADGQLARPPAPGKFPPTTIERLPGVALADVVAVAPGFLHVCALLGDGSVWCWGRNARGQLGNGTRTDSFVPVRVQGLP
jgi:alpha-tubulin suppressor-like RCC1 family protein